MRHADAQPDARVALLLASVDLLDGVGANLDVGVGVENAGQEAEGAWFATGVRQLEQTAFLQGGENAAHESLSAGLKVPGQTGQERGVNRARSGGQTTFSRHG